MSLRRHGGRLDTLRHSHRVIYVTLSLLWSSSRRVFLWQDLTEPVPHLPGKTYFITQSGGKEILGNQPNPF